MNKKYVKCSYFGKDISNSLRFFLGSEIVCEECFIYNAEKVKKFKNSGLK
jgi:hypothetical protein